MDKVTEAIERKMGIATDEIVASVTIQLLKSCQSICRSYWQ
jgi:hypothetical protein